MTIKSLLNPEQREEIIRRIQLLDENSKADWGKMTNEQIGIFAYKHCDHHLRQFGV